MNRRTITIVKKKIVLLFSLISFIILAVSCNTFKTINAVQWNDIIERREGNTIYLKRGSFKVGSTIVLHSGMNIVGNETILIPSDRLVYPVMKINDVTNVAISGITVKGKALVNTSDKIYLGKANYKYVLEVFNSGDIDIENCKFVNSEATAIKVLDSKNINFFKNEFRNIGLSTVAGAPYSYDGIYLGGKASVSNIKIDSCSFINIGKTFARGKVKWPNDGDGIQVLINGVAKNIKITNSIFDKCSARGVKVQSGENVIIDNNLFIDSGSAVIMPMLQEIRDITISNNKVLGSTVPFGIDKGGAPCDAVNLNIINNEIDSCVHFFRTSGYSNMRNGLIQNNRVGKVGQFVISGRFMDSEISNNDIDAFATSGHKGWTMAFLLSPESNNVVVENNSFGTIRKGTRIFDNRSKNKVVLRNNEEKKIK